VAKDNGDVLGKTVLKIQLQNWNAIFDQFSNCCIVREEAGALSCFVTPLYT
jgi:hypothetical protein